jgi:HEAT repeat protein
MKVTSRFWIWSLVILLLGFLVVPELVDWWYQYQLDSRISREKQKVAELVQARDRGYDDLVRLVPSLWFGNVPPALKGILAQEKRDRVADLCAIYVACGQKRNPKEAIARVLGQLGDPRASTVLIKDLESVWPGLPLIQYDAQIEALGSIRAKDAGDLLLKILRQHYSWEGSAWKTKEEAFVALGKIGDERALPDASRSIGSSEDWYIRRGAMNYLTHIGNSAAKAALMEEFQRDHESETGLCLVQVGETSIMPEVQSRLKNWLDNYSAGGWNNTDFWGIFYCVHALLLAKDTDAIPELRRALVVLKKDDAKTQEYVRDDASGYSAKLLLDERSADTLVFDLEVFLKTHSTIAQ